MMDKTPRAGFVVDRGDLTMVIDRILAWRGPITRSPAGPVLVHKLGARWPACTTWSAGHFASLAPELRIPVKTWRPQGVDVAEYRMKDYAALLAGAAGSDVCLPYCHDIPLFALIPELTRDCEEFPTHVLPQWYRPKWWRYAQFFIGPARSLTPLHFDTLLTHNVFFQIRGRKRFTLLPPEQLALCSRRGWRWCDVDPERPNLDHFTDYSGTTPVEVVVGPGDLLYMPPGTLHSVRGLDESISFNIDFHTKASVLHALGRVSDGMPMASAYYNLVTALGVVCGVPSSLLFRFYRSYLSYLS